MGACYIQARDGFRKLCGDRWLRDMHVALGTVCCLFLVSMAQASGTHMKMWTDAVRECQKTNTSLPQLYLSRSPEDRINLTDSAGPLWLMGFEEHSEGKWFAITYTNVSHKANVKCGEDIEGKYTYAEANDKCIRAGKPLLRVTPYNVSVVGALDNFNSSFWIDTIKPGEFINADGNDVQILCFILTETGEIQTDNCTNRHPFKCVKGSLAPVVVYQGAKGSLYERYPSRSKTTPTPTSRVTPTSRGTNNDVSVTTVTKNTTRASTPRSKARANLMDQDLLLAMICTGAAVLLAVVVAVCCCCCRQNRHGKRGSSHLADNYSETADSVTFNALKTPEASEYATPSDALGGVGPQTARPRSSLIEGEYDVLQQANTQAEKPKRKVAIVNAYNHVTIVPPNQNRASGPKEGENEYDVSTLHKQTKVTVDPEKESGNVYGHVDIR